MPAMRSANIPPAPDGWKIDPDGTGYILVPPPPPPPPGPEAIPYGWKEDPDGSGLIRIPDEELPPPPRAGYWCKLKDLQQNTDMNGLLVELLTLEPDKDGIVQVQNADDKYWVKPTNLVPVEGTEKVARCAWRCNTRSPFRRVAPILCPAIRASLRAPIGRNLLTHCLPPICCCGCAPTSQLPQRRRKGLVAMSAPRDLARCRCQMTASCTRRLDMDAFVVP